MILKIVPVRPPSKPTLQHSYHFVEGAEFKIELHTFEDLATYEFWLRKRSDIKGLTTHFLYTYLPRRLGKFQVFAFDVQNTVDGSISTAAYTVFCKKLFLLNDKGKTVDTFNTINPAEMKDPTEVVNEALETLKAAAIKSTEKQADHVHELYKEGSAEEGKVEIREIDQPPPIDKQTISFDRPSPEYLKHMSQRYEDTVDVPSRQCVAIEDLKQCPDVLSWCMDSNYLNLPDSSRPFPANMKILLDTFQDVCPDCGFHLVCGKCLFCRKERHKLFAQPIYEVLGIRGQRTGNSFLSAVAATYQLHKALMAGNLAEYYGTEPSTQFEMTFVDPEKRIWDYFWQLIVASPWFQNYFNYLEDKYPDGPVGGFKQSNNDMVVFDHHNLTVRSGDLKVSYRGGTRIFATIDCPDWVQFLNQDDDEDDDGYTLDVEDTYTALSNSMVTAKSKAKQHSLALQPLLFCLGSPNPEVGFLKKKKEELEGNPRYLTYHQPTWKVNPEVTKKQLIKDIGYDWLFLRDFGAEY